MYKTVQKTCYTKVFYVTAFGFVGCILCLEGFGAFHFFHTQGETCWSINTSISCETSSNFDICNTFVASKPMFSYKFSLNQKICNLKIDVSCEASRQFSTHLTKCHACHGICTLSPLHAALKMRFAKNEPQGTSKVLRLPRKMKMDTPKVLRLPRKMTMMVSKVLRPPRKMQCV